MRGILNERALSKAPLTRRTACADLSPHAGRGKQSVCRTDSAYPLNVGCLGCTASLKLSKPFQAGSGGSQPACGA
jgi:hypothetical protein